MNVREAILKAAGQIEMRPNTFSFSSGYAPSCGTPGCALGWIGHFAGVQQASEFSYYPNEVCCVLGMDEVRFYAEMNSLSPRIDGTPTWTLSAEVCAATLRLYADKYHPAEKRGMPDSARAIFETEQERVA